MKLNIKSLRDGANAYHFASGQDGWLDSAIQRVISRGVGLKGALSLSLEVDQLHPDYVFRGKLAFRVEEPCARCAEPVEGPVEHRFTQLYTQVAQDKGNGVELGDSSEEADTSFFKGPEIDLSPMIEEQVVLGLPYSVLCMEGCKGICQSCGQNRNKASCQCKDEDKETPFSVLRQLKN